jgi:hypothetical protein
MRKVVRKITLDAKWHMGATNQQLVAYGRKSADCRRIVERASLSCTFSPSIAPSTIDAVKRAILCSARLPG